MPGERTWHLWNSKRTRHISGSHPASPVEAGDRNPVWRFLQHAGTSPRILSQGSNLIDRFPRQLRAGRCEPADGEHLLCATGLLLVVADSVTGLTASHFFHLAVEWQCQQLTNAKAGHYKDRDSLDPERAHKRFNLSIPEGLSLRQVVVQIVPRALPRPQIYTCQNSQVIRQRGGLHSVTPVTNRSPHRYPNWNPSRRLHKTRQTFSRVQHNIEDRERPWHGILAHLRACHGIQCPAQTLQGDALCVKSG